MVMVISQPASACHMGSGDIMFSSIGPTLVADSYRIHVVFAAFAFSTHAWVTLRTSTCAAQSTFFVCCRVVTCETSVVIVFMAGPLPLHSGH